jgi:predicted aconitase with swiveling domain
MSEITLKGRTVCPGKAEGEAVVLQTPFSFLGELSPITGLLKVPGSESDGQSVKNKILVCPGGKGSTGGPTFAFLAQEAGNAPKAIVCTSIEPVLALGVLTAEIPTVDSLDQDPTKIIKTGDHLIVDASHGLVKIVRNE